MPGRSQRNAVAALAREFDGTMLAEETGTFTLFESSEYDRFLKSAPVPVKPYGVTMEIGGSFTALQRGRAFAGSDQLGTNSLLQED